MATKPATPATPPEEAQAPVPVRNVVIFAGYRGPITDERYIPEGTYAETDPVVLGLAEYLVELGRARWE
jgi:hypothetical protein